MDWIEGRPARIAAPQPEMPHPATPERKISEGESRSAQALRQEEEAVRAAYEAIDLEKLKASVLAEHKADSAAYRFSCRRFGDFMELCVTRLGLRTPSVIDRDQSKTGPITTTHRINLGLVRDISLAIGREPGRVEPAAFYLSVRSASDNTLWGVSGMWANEARGDKLVARFDGDFPPLRKPFSEKGDGRGFWPSNLARGWPNTDVPCRAEDDVIFFYGASLSVNAPFGMGQSVIDAVMAEIEKAYVAPQAAE